MAFDRGFPYVGTELDARPLPRLRIYIPRPHHGAAPVGLAPIVDTGAEHTAFDGSLASALGWTADDIADRAEAARPVYGLGMGGQALTGYLHRLRCLIPLGPRYADIMLRVLVTPPNTLATPVLGRQDFFRQVDFALVEAEQQFYLRFRDRSALHDSW